MEEPRRMYRSRSERILGGVAGGLGSYFGVDPVIFRLVFLVLSLFSGFGFVVYFVLWLLLPLEGTLAVDSRTQMQENVGDMQDTTQRIASQLRGMFRR